MALTFQQTATSYSPSGSPSVAATLPSAVAAGSTIIVCVNAKDGQGHTTGITDNAVGGSNTYALLFDAGHVGNDWMTFWVATNTFQQSSLSVTATKSISSPVNTPILITSVLVYTGVGISLSVDQSIAGAALAGSVATWTWGPTAGLSSTEELVLSFMSESNGTNQAFTSSPNTLRASYTSTPHGYYQFIMDQQTTTNAGVSGGITIAGNDGSGPYTTLVSFSLSFQIVGRTQPGATLTLTGAASGTTSADGNGLYTFTNLSPGSYTVTPSLAGTSFAPPSASVVITDSSVTLNFVGKKGVFSTSTYTLQNEIDKVQGLADIEPIFNVGGWTTEPTVTIATDVFAAICAVNFPHKWNEIKLPPFYTFSWQQDYALLNPDFSSIYNVEWLQNGVAFDINNNTVPKPYVRVETGRSLPQRTGGDGNGSMMGDPGFIVASLPNSELYYGVWGQPNVASPTLGNNPVAGSVYTNPVGNYSQPANPISQIIDANGNLLVITTYGTEGSAAPLAPANAAPGTQVSGTGASTVWTVVDPVGMGMRIIDIPSQTGVVWQFNLIGQKIPTVFTYLGQTLAPLPDKYEPFFRAGFIAQLYRYSPLEKTRAKFKDEWQLWLKSLSQLKEVQDRELEEYSFITERTIMGSGRRRNTFQGAAWPYNYPRP